MTIQKQLVPSVLFVMWHNLVHKMKAKDEILKCGRSLPKLVENDSNDSNFCNNVQVKP